MKDTIKEDTALKFPVYAKLAQLTLGIIGFFFVMYIGQDIIIPLVFALIIAILLDPVVNFLCRFNINRIIAILISLVLAIILIASLFYFIISQASMFSDSLPLLKQKVALLFDDAINWASQSLNISKPKITAWIQNTKGETLGNGSAFIGQSLSTIGGVLMYVFILPVYVFMILFYKALLLEFIAMLFKKSKHAVVAEVLMETKVLIQSYLVGLLLEAALVATLNSAGLLILGLDYAILIGIIGALLNVIPYIGGIVAIAIPMFLAIATKSPIDALWVFIIYMVVQFIDNNFIVPKIVASKVKVNALISIIVVLVGGALWGVAGMFLSIPITAIIKVIFDRVEALTPFGFLIGDNQPDIGKAIFVFKKPFKASKLKAVDKSAT